jgi:hypothetical protein
MTPTRLWGLALGIAFLLGSPVAARAQEKPLTNTEPGMRVAKNATLVSVAADRLVAKVGSKETTFVISGEVAESAKKFKPGDPVSVFYTEADGKKIVSKLSSTSKGARGPGKEGKKARPDAASEPTAAPKQ